MVEVLFEGVDAGYAASAVVRDVSFVLRSGFLGLVGANGAGKTTLLRLLSGDLRPLAGAVRVRPREATVVLCPQEVGEISDDVRGLALRRGALHGELGLDAAPIERWSTLSPGERKRWQIGAALAREPDVLLLDEPTNHLDARGRALLLRALARHRGVGMIVSHDRALLDHLATSILRIVDGRATWLSGGYSEAAIAWERAREAEERAHRDAKARVRTLGERLDTARRAQRSADGQRSSRARMKGPRDHDARGSLAKGRARMGEASAGRAVTVARADLERALRDVPRIGKERALAREVFASFVPAPRGPRFFVDADRIGPLSGVSITVDRDDRVRIRGDNGAGKTTLLRALVASRPERTLYLPQELEPREVTTHVEALFGLDDGERGRVLSIFAALGSDPARLFERARDDRERLSPGEARKLVLAFGLGTSASALVLDEPTNHLDLPSIERLEHAVAIYPGTVVVVSHDDAFAEAVTSRSIEIAAGRVR